MSSLSEQYVIVPVPTRILTHHDDICDAILEFGKDKIGPNDVVCAAESVVAITQGMAKRCEEFEPGFVAKILSHMFPAKGSISSWYSMQSLIAVEGTGKVLYGFILGCLAKCVGISGTFYRHAGYQARLIDDITGTMPPYDKHIVYGPKDPVGVSEAITKACGCYGAAIADVNDLKRSHILGVSKGVDADKVAEILINNPFGNGSEKTPICIIKDYNKA